MSSEVCPHGFNNNFSLTLLASLPATVSQTYWSSNTVAPLSPQSCLSEDPVTGKRVKQGTDHSLPYFNFLVSKSPVSSRYLSFYFVENSVRLQPSGGDSQLPSYIVHPVKNASWIRPHTLIYSHRRCKHTTSLHTPLLKTGAVSGERQTVQDDKLTC